MMPLSAASASASWAGASWSRPANVLLEPCPVARTRLSTRCRDSINVPTGRAYANGKVSSANIFRHKYKVDYN